MRKIVLNSVAEYQALNARLQGTPSKRALALKSLERLNPHVNFAAVEKGTVILLPALPAFRGETATSVASDAFRELRDELLSSLKGAVLRNADAGDAMLFEHKEVEMAFQSEVVLRMGKAEPAFKNEIDAAREILKADQKAAKDTAKAMLTFEADVAAELDSLGKLFD